MCVCVCVCVREREREGERECVWVRERARAFVLVQSQSFESVENSRDRINVFCSPSRQHEPVLSPTTNQHVASCGRFKRDISVKLSIQNQTPSLLISLCEKELCGWKLDAGIHYIEYSTVSREVVRRP